MAKSGPSTTGAEEKQNSFSSLAETIYTISVDVVPAWAACVVRACQREGRAGASPDELPDWLHLDKGAEDLPDAFRGCPLLPEHQPAVVVAIWHPRKAAWRFGVMLGCPYGLGSVVVTFNRYPTLVVAAQRRILGLLTGAYFDDILTMDIAATSRQAKGLGNWLWLVLGTPPKPPKAYPMQSHRPFLGSVPDLSSITSDGSVTITPREASRRHVRNDIETAISTGVFTSVQASRTRGRCGWVATNSFGRIGRLGTAVLK